MLELFTHFAHVTFQWQHTKAAMLGLDTHKVTRLISQSEMVCATGATVYHAHFSLDVAGNTHTRSLRVPPT